MPANYLLPGSYSINAAINLPNHREFDFREDVMTFDVTTAGWGRTDYAPQDLGCVSIPVDGKECRLTLPKPSESAPETERDGTLKGGDP